MTIVTTTSHLRALRLINFRNYADATVRLSPGLNVVIGDNAQGKTNLLEGISFAATGSSPRTPNDPEVVRWGTEFARAEMRVTLEGEGERAVAVGYAPGQKKRLTVDGAASESLAAYAAGGAGVRVVVDPTCTLETPRLFSHRRGAPTGRQAGVIWIRPPRHP